MRNTQGVRSFRLRARSSAPTRRTNSHDARLLLRVFRGLHGEFLSFILSSTVIDTPEV